MSIEIEAWVRAWRGPLTGWFVRRGVSLGQADERVTDVFVRAWIGRERFGGKATDEKAVGAWLLGIARNVDREAARRPKLKGFENTDQVLSIPNRDSSEGSTQDSDQNRRLRAAIDRLPPIERALIGAFYFEDSSTKRIARVFGLSERAVEGRLRRARERLRDSMRSRQGVPESPLGITK